MQEPQKPRFIPMECQGKECRSFLEEAAKRMNLIYGSQSSTKQSFGNARKKDSLPTDFESEIQAEKESQITHAQAFADEKEALSELNEKIPELRLEAGELVQQRMSEARIALERIKGEVAEYGIPWNNDNQEQFFVSKCEAYQPFDKKTSEAKGYQTSVNNLAKDITRRLEWLDWKINQLKQKLMGPSLA